MSFDGRLFALRGDGIFVSLDGRLLEGPIVVGITLDLGDFGDRGVRLFSLDDGAEGAGDTGLIGFCERLEFGGVCCLFRRDGLDFVDTGTDGLELSWVGDLGGKPFSADEVLMADMPLSCVMARIPLKLKGPACWHFNNGISYTISKLPVDAPELCERSTTTGGK